MNCGEARKLISPYLDGRVSGAEMHALNRHMEKCSECRREYAALQRTQQLVAGLGPVKAPADLALKLRVAISRQTEHARRQRLAGMWVRFENALNAIMVPATAGLVSAVLIFGVLLGFFALPGQLQASNGDVPLMLYTATAPQLERSVFGTSLGSISDDSVVVEALVDANGRVQDFRILSQPEGDDSVAAKVKNVLILTTFKPATLMGRPTVGRAVISFSKISVRG
jgi:Putative zinc-finger